MDGFFNGCSFLVEADKILLNGNWSTIDAALTPIVENEEGLTMALDDGVQDLIADIAVCKDFPDEILQRHLAKLVISTNFYRFARTMRVKFASINLPKAPVKQDIKRILSFNALPDLTWAISRMSAEEIHGLLDHLVENTQKIDLRISLAIITRIYNIQIISREVLLLIVANCH